ncbi:MAG: alanine racemase [Lachnospiraceae bacterium]|nr:alanine racemase [Lachnospiraceae bacterium]
MERIFLNLYPDRIRANIHRISRARPAGTRRCLVIKADAYGLGAQVLAPLLNADVDFFATATAFEGISLRGCGVTKPILILGFTAREDWPALMCQKIRITVYRKEDAEDLSAIATRLGETALVHFKVDTGMNRLGFEADEEGIALMARLARLPGLELEGLFSHFARADEADLTATRRQYALFQRVKEGLAREGVKPPICHIANSAAALAFPEAAEQMVRLGLAAYGHYPSEEMSRPLDLLPVSELKSHVVMVKDLFPGEEVSYGGHFAAKEAMRIATVPVGYADGYTRRLSGKGRVLIHGQYAPIIGNICMDQMMVDVSHIPGVRLGDIVTLIGRDGEQEITLEELAEKSGILHYEIQCGLSRWRNERHIIREEIEETEPASARDK